MSKVKYTFTSIHKWGGLVLGVLLTLICSTGAILSFEKELLPLTIKTIYYHPTHKDEVAPLRISQIVTKLQQSEGREVKTISQPANPKRNLVVNFADAPQTDVYVHPASGEIVGSFTYQDSFFSKVRELHRFLLIGKTGRLITGSASLFFLFLLISGVVINLPKTFSRFISFFRLDWRGNSFRKTFRLHVVLGWYAFVFLLIMSLTGPFWSFGWYNRGLSAMFGVKPTTSNRHKASEPTRVKQLTPEMFSRMEDKMVVISSVQTNWKEMRLTLPSLKEENFTIAVIPENQIHGRQSDMFTYGLSDGSLKKESVFKTKSLQETFRMWVFALHTGSWGGWFGRLLYCIAAIIGATLPLTGYVLWWKKRKIKKRNKL